MLTGQYYFSADACQCQEEDAAYPDILFNGVQGTETPWTPPVHHNRKLSIVYKDIIVFAVAIHFLTNSLLKRLTSPSS